MPVGLESPWRLVLLGAPGVGKGTQALLLSQRLGACHLSTGDVFRAAGGHPECDQTPAMRAAMQYMRRGELVPDSTVWEMVHERSGCLRCRGGFILDGFPRNVKQAQALAASLNVKLKQVVKASTVQEPRPIMPMAKMSMAMSANAPTPIEASQISISATVMLTYEIE